MSMRAEDWARIRVLFDGAVALAAAERPAFSP